MVMATDYRARLKAWPVDSSCNRIFYSSEGTEIINGYLRIVIGKRGPYVECSKEQLFMKNLYIPEECEWRTKSYSAFYAEYRSQDAASLKVYFQKKRVDYADYRPGLFYISPFYLCYKSTRVTIFGTVIDTFIPMIVPLTKISKIQK